MTKEVALILDKARGRGEYVYSGNIETAQSLLEYLLSLPELQLHN
jgi:hypothetical protein